MTARACDPSHRPSGIGSGVMYESVRKHAVISGLQLLASLLAMASFFSTNNFLHAVTPEQARADGNPLPAGWTAGVMNHGSYYHWWTIQERPILFGVSATCLTLCVLFVYGSLLGMAIVQCRGNLTDENGGTRDS